MNEEGVCREVTCETHVFYARHHAALRDRGYHVMYGPPRDRPPIMFIGYQPGGDQRTSDHLAAAPDQWWPTDCLYATATWPLAVRMRTMFGSALLHRCTGLNAIFMRSPNVQTYRQEVPVAMRREVAAFCRTRVERVVEALNPRLIVAIGFDALRAFGATATVLRNPQGRTLMLGGAIAGRPAVATLHLSGAQIATVDRRAIADHVLARVAP